MIPKPIREQLGLVPGTVLRVRVEGKRVVLEPLTEPPSEVFVEAGPEVAGEALREAKSAGDKVAKLLRDLGVELD